MEKARLQSESCASALQPKYFKYSKGHNSSPFPSFTSAWLVVTKYLHIKNYRQPWQSASNQSNHFLCNHFTQREPAASRNRCQPVRKYMFFCSNERLHHVQYDRQLLSNMHMMSHEKPQLSVIAKQLFCGLCIQPCVRAKSEIFTKKEIHFFTFTDMKLKDVCYSDPSVEMCNPGNQEN